MSAANEAEPVPEHISGMFATISALDPWCWRLLGQLLRSHSGFTAEGIPVIDDGTNTVARWLRWEPKTVTEHAEHLRAAGLIEVERPPYSRVVYYVTCWCHDCEHERQSDRSYMDGVAW